VVAALVLVGGVGLADGAAAADPSCPPNSVCLFSEQNFEGQEIILGGPFTLNNQIPNMHIIGCAGCVSTRHPGSNGTWGDQLSSFINTTTLNYCMLFDVNYGGPGSVLEAGRAASYGELNRFNDQASSIRLC
jgi:hypothetical protein